MTVRRWNESAIKADQDVADIIAEEEVESEYPALFRKIQQEPVKLRENFAETAFFYPALVTDEAGDVAFSFTMPESQHDLETTTVSTDRRPEIRLSVPRNHDQ